MKKRMIIALLLGSIAIGMQQIQTTMNGFEKALASAAGSAVAYGISFAVGTSSAFKNSLLLTGATLPLKSLALVVEPKETEKERADLIDKIKEVSWDSVINIENISYATPPLLFLINSWNNMRNMLVFDLPHDRKEKQKSSYSDLTAEEKIKKIQKKAERKLKKKEESEKNEANKVEFYQKAAGALIAVIAENIGIVLYGSVKALLTK